MYDDMGRDELLDRIRALEKINSNQFAEIETFSQVLSDVNRDLLASLHLLADGLRRVEGAIDAIEKLVEEPDL